jgi:hypothetical protein
MQLTLKIVGKNLPRPSSARERATRLAELSSALKIVSDHLAATGARDGRIENGSLCGSFCIEDF